MRNIFEITLEVFKMQGKTKDEAFNYIREVEAKHGIVIRDSRDATSFEYWVTNEYAGDELMPIHTIKHKIKRLSKATGITYAQMARDCGVGISTFTNMLSDANKKFIKSTIYRRIVDYLTKQGVKV